jgi:hypothetical protein
LVLDVDVDVYVALGDVSADYADVVRRDCKFALDGGKV